METTERVIEAQLSEYLAVREEITGAIANQHVALSFGTGALVAAFGAGVFSWDTTVAPAIFFAIVPLSWWILMMWLGEVVRMLRAAEFCGIQAQRINATILEADPTQREALHWESWRRNPDKPERTITWTYASMAVLLLFSNVAALGGATVTAIQTGWPTWVIAMIWALGTVAGLAFASWVRGIFNTWASADVGMNPTRFTRLFERRRHSPGD